MKTLIVTTAIGLTMLAAPLAADESGTTTGTGATTDYMLQSQGMLPAGDRVRSYDNTAPETADPQFGPQGGDAGDSDGAGAGADGAGASGGEGGEGAAGEDGSAGGT